MGNEHGQGAGADISADRVRAHTAPEVNARIDRATEARIQHYAGASREELSRRIAELDREWDMERYLEMNASALAFAGLTLGLAHSKKWLIIPGFVLPLLFQHAVQGWCPPVPVFRRLGIRTRKEIDREKYALKALRGDFDKLQGAEAEAAARPARALQAVSA
jgi:hypothetical protein